MNSRSIAIFLGLGLLGCASQPTVAPTPSEAHNAPSASAATTEQAPAEPVATPAAVDVSPEAAPASTPPPPAEEAAAAPIASTAAAGKKKKSPTKPVPPAAKPAAAVAAAPAPAPAAPPAPPMKPAVVAAVTYSGPDACTLATKGDSSVAAACARGGLKEARKEMKRMLKKAKDSGHKTDCDDCHPDDDFGKLTSDGREKFKELARLGAM